MPVCQSGHLQGIIGQVSFTYQIFSFVIDEPPTAFQLPTQDERGHRHKLYLTNLGPDCRNFVCIYTSPQPPYPLRRASRKVRCLTPSSDDDPRCYGDYFVISGFVNPRLFLLALSLCQCQSAVHVAPLSFHFNSESPVSPLHPLSLGLCCHPRITKHSYLSKQGCPTKWSASAQLYKHCSSVLY
jgi:hypothetical protein